MFQLLYRIDSTLINNQIRLYKAETTRKFTTRGLKTACNSTCRRRRRLVSKLQKEKTTSRERILGIHNKKKKNVLFKLRKASSSTMRIPQRYSI